MSEAAHLEWNPSTMSFEVFAPQFLMIAPKKGGLVPFKLNEPQLKIEEVIAEIQAEGRPVRLIILKARQLGFSTWSLGRMYQYTTTRTGVMTFLAAHDDDSTRDLFERCRLFYDMAPEKPMIRNNNRTELDFSNPDRRSVHIEPGLQSRIRLGTAGKARLGRSKTLRYLHLSEVAFWDNAQRVLLGLEQALPDDSDTVEIIESTANGVGGEFYKRWKRAEDPSTRGEWRAVFFAWFDFAEYERPLVAGQMEQVPSCVEDVAEFEKHERGLKSTRDLTDEQLNWRRWAIVNKCGNDMDSFRQEFPESPMDAFLTSGRPVFNRDRLQFRRNELEAEDLRRKVAKRATRWIEGVMMQKAGEVKFQPQPGGPLRVYSLPQRSSDYHIGCDTASGESVGNDPDFCEAHVYDRFTWEQVAVYRERTDPVTFAKMCTRLGYFYKRAKLVPEVNNHGHTFCVKLKEFKYPRVFHRQDFDKFGTPPVMRMGFETNQKTRPILIDSTVSAINDRAVVFNDIPTIDQHLTFIRDKKTGKPQAEEGCHDDGVVATGLALLSILHGPQQTGRSSKVTDQRISEDAKLVKKMIARQVAMAKEARQQWHRGSEDI